MKLIWAIGFALWCLVVIVGSIAVELDTTIAGQENQQELYVSEPEGLEKKRERRETRKYGKYTVNCDSLDGTAVFISWSDGELTGEVAAGTLINCAFFLHNFYVGPPDAPNSKRTKVNMEDNRILVQSPGCITKEYNGKCNSDMIWNAASVKWTANRPSFRCFTPDSTDCNAVKATVAGTIVQGAERSCTRTCPSVVATVTGPIVDLEAQAG